MTLDPVLDRPPDQLPGGGRAVRRGQSAEVFVIVQVKGPEQGGVGPADEPPVDGPSQRCRPVEQTELARCQVGGSEVRSRQPGAGGAARTRVSEAARDQRQGNPWGSKPAPQRPAETVPQPAPQLLR